MYRCLNLHSHNDPGCNPSMHDKVCTWCCDDEVCVRTLASGVYVLPDGHTTPPPPATTSPPPTTNQPLMSTTTTPSPPGKQENQSVANIALLTFDFCHV
ncbi:hypothetical protein BaRGS_00018935 [Batillaria attramentaria]|uniref:Uncharacterized protein n=1 Tax=Batillaria attramentaria TaxID=370345 RepID=A0ABD0KSC5_9CAEN